MTWIPDVADGPPEFARVFGLRENLFARFGDFYARLWDPAVVDPVVLDLCRLRVAQLVGCGAELAVRSRPAVTAGLSEETVADLASWPASSHFDETQRACLGFAEQFVIDPSGIDADHRARVRAAIGYRRLVGLAQALAVFDGFARFRTVLGIDEQLGARGRRVTVVDVGEPDPSMPAGEVPAGDPDDPAHGFSDAQPGLFASFERLYAVLWSEGVVDHPSKEVARLRNARITGCKFCRNVRFARARADGLTEDRVALVADGYEDSALPEAHKAVIALTDCFLIDPRHGPDETTRRVMLAQYGPAGTVEVAAGLALFMGFSKIAVALGAFPDDFPTLVIPTPGAAAQDATPERLSALQSSSRRAATKASWGTSTRPMDFMLLLALLLLLEQFPLPRDVTAVALGQDVLASGLDRLPGDDPSPDGRLDRHVEELAGNERAQLLGHPTCRTRRPGPCGPPSRRRPRVPG